VSLTAKAALAWLALFVVMFANGIVRVAVLQPQLGEERARQVASLTGLLLVLLLSRLFVGFADAATVPDFWRVGVAWLTATVAFEFPYGRFVSSLSWEALLADYDIFHGRLRSLILLGLLFGPVFWATIAKRR
jgi:hypothetical protein